MDLLLQYIIALGTTSVVLFAIAVFVYIQNPKNKVNRIYALYSLAISMWSGCETYSIAAPTKIQGLLWWRINHVGVALIPPFFIHFVACLIDKEKELQKVIRGVYLLSLIFIVLDMTPLLIDDVALKFSFKHMVVPGKLYALFLGYWVIVISFGLFRLFQVYLKSSGIKRNQLKYFCWASLLGYIGGPPNFLPAYNIEIFPLMPFGTYAIPVYVLIITYPIVKYRLMDIRVAVTRTGIFLGVYILLLGIPFYIGYRYIGFQTKTWLIPVSASAVLATIGPFTYRTLQRKTEELIFRKSRQYQQILLSSSEDILAYKDKQDLFSEIAALIFDNVSPSFVAIYLFENKKYCLEVSNPEDVRLPPELDSRHFLIEELNSKEGLLFERSLNSTFVSLALSIGRGENVKGVILLGEKKTRELYSNEDIEVFKILLNQASLALENIQHIREAVEEHREKDRLKKEMELATQIQRSLLPKTDPCAGDFQTAGILLSALEVAGDYYDFIVYSPQKIGVVVADVSGKGMDSGMVMSMTKTALHALSRQNLSCKELVVQLNNILCEELNQQKFVSLIYAEYTSTDSIFTWAGAGHEHVLVYRATQNEGDTGPQVEIIKTGGIVLGMFESIEDKIDQQSIVLNRGDRIILYTDGVTEARNSAREMFSLKRLVETIRQSPVLPVKDQLSYIEERVQQFIQDEPQYDDITLVVMGRE